MALLEKFWTVIKPLRSSIAGRIPTAAAVGELAVNDADEILYLKKEDGSFVEWESKKEYNIFSYDYTIPEQGQRAGEDIWYKVGNIYEGTLSRGVFNVRFTRSSPGPNPLYEVYGTIIIEVLGAGLRLLQSHKIEDLNFRWLVTDVPNSGGSSKNRELYINVNSGGAWTNVYLKQVSGALFVAETSTTPVSLADIPGSKEAILLSNAI